MEPRPRQELDVQVKDFVVRVIPAFTDEGAEIYPEERIYGRVMSITGDVIHVEPLRPGRSAIFTRFNRKTGDIIGISDGSYLMKLG